MNIINRFKTENHIIHFDNEPIIELATSIPWMWNNEAKVETIVNDFRMVHDCKTFADWCAECDLDPDLNLFGDYYAAHSVMAVMLQKLGVEVIQQLIEYFDPETPINLLTQEV